MKLRNSLRFSYLLAVWSCLSCAFGGRFLGGGSDNVLFGVVLIAGGFAMSASAMMLASVNGPDPALWRRSAHPSASSGEEAADMVRDGRPRSLPRRTSS